MLEGIEVIDCSPFSYGDQGTPTTPEWSDTDSNDDSLVSHPMDSITIPGELIMLSLGTQGKMLDFTGLRLHQVRDEP